MLRLTEVSKRLGARAEPQLAVQITLSLAPCVNVLFSRRMNGPGKATIVRVKAGISSGSR
jgi:hypothetical protein